MGSSPSSARAPRVRRGRGGRGGAEPRARISARAARVVELATQGVTQRAIAAAVGVSQAAVCKILQRADDQVLADLHRERVRFLARVHRRLEHVYAEAHDAWRRSTVDRERRVQRRTTLPDGRAATTVALHTDTQIGDPRFIREMLRCLRDLDHTFALSQFDWARIAAEQEEATPPEPTPSAMLSSDSPGPATPDTTEDS